jgi:nucleoid-associated protein YejK
MTGSAGAGDEVKRERLMTVVRVRTHREHTDVMFVESARIYRLRRDIPGYDEALRRLQRAVGSGRPVRVRLDRPNGEIIERVD